MMMYDVVMCERGNIWPYFKINIYFLYILWWYTQTYTQVVTRTIIVQGRESVEI